MLTEIVNALSDVIAVGAIFSVILFIGVYTKLAPWWREPVGLTLVLAEFFILALYVSILLHIVFLPAFNAVPVWVSIVDLFITGGIMGVNIWRTFVWFKIARKLWQDDRNR